MQLSLKLPMWVAKEKYVNDIKAVTKKKKRCLGKYVVMVLSLYLEKKLSN